MGQKDEKQALFDRLRKQLVKMGRINPGDVRGYARMRKAMLEREKRSAQDLNDTTSEGPT